MEVLEVACRPSVLAGYFLMDFRGDGGKLCIGVWVSYRVYTAGYGT